MESNSENGEIHCSDVSAELLQAQDPAANSILRLGDVVTITLLPEGTS